METGKSFEALRSDVAAIDREIVRLLLRRTHLSAQAVSFKNIVADISDSALVDSRLARVRSWAREDGVSEELVGDVFSVILRHSVAAQTELFQGMRRR